MVSALLNVQQNLQSSYEARYHNNNTKIHFIETVITVWVDK